jgi:hypothetical protein
VRSSPTQIACDVEPGSRRPPGGRVAAWDSNLQIYHAHSSAPPTQRLVPDARSLRGGAGPRERSASAAVQNLPAAAGRAARVAARPRLDATQPAAPAPSRAGRQLLDRESVLAASVGQPDREAPGGPESARSGDERLRPHPARRGAGRGAGGRHPSRVENNKLASASTSWLSRGPSPRAPGRRPPRASPSPGQSAASAALAGHNGLVLSQAPSSSRSRTDLPPPRSTTS